MTPQERQMIDDLFDRLAKLESAPRDPDAVAAIAQGLRQAPNAVYALVQTVLLQDEALKRANSRIQELESAAAGQQHPSGGFLDSMRETVFGQNPPRGSVPNVQPPDMASRPVWNSGRVMQQAQPPGQQYGQGQGSYGQPYGAPQAPMGGMGGGGSFLGTAAAAAAGTIGGSLLLGSIRSMMGGEHHGFGDAAGLGGTGLGGTGLGSTGSGDKTVSDQSNSDLARDAGVNDIGSSGSDIGSSGSSADDNSRAGMFDSASNDSGDDHDDGNDDGNDDMDGDDFGGDGDSDYA